MRVLHEAVLDALAIPPQAIDEVAAREGAELDRRDRAYRAGRPLLAVAGRSVLVIDDGLATGATMWAAVSALRAQRATRIVVAVPVGPQEACDELAELADEVVCIRTPRSFQAVGQWYDDFSQTTDNEIRALLGLGEDDRGQ